MRVVFVKKEIFVYTKNKNCDTADSRNIIFAHCPKIIKFVFDRHRISSCDPTRNNSIHEIP